MDAIKVHFRHHFEYKETISSFFLIYKHSICPNVCKACYPKEFFFFPKNQSGTEISSWESAGTFSPVVG